MATQIQGPGGQIYTLGAGVTPVSLNPGYSVYNGGSGGGGGAGASPGNNGAYGFGATPNIGPSAPSTETPVTEPNAPASAETATKGQTSTIPSTITIEAGETLSGIAKNLGTNIQELMRLNPSIKNPNVIPSGGQLTVPGVNQSKIGSSGGNANQYQQNVQSAISGVTDLNDGATVRAVAASVPYSTSDLLPPSANNTVQNLISTYMQQVSAHEQQGTTNLVSDYQTEANNLGIPALQTQYMNLENVINGTPDDIRAEVTKAGGFMSESQVQALSSARNKNIINQANMIQMQLSNAQNTLSTMTDLDEKQQALAEQQFNDSTGATQNLISYYQTAQTQATDQFKAIVANVGYTGLAANLQGNPYEQQIAEQSLGLQPGTLSNKNALQNLETYRQQTLQQGAAKIVELGAQTSYYGARTEQSLTGAAGNIAQDYTTSPEYQAVSNGALYLNRISTDIQNPGSVSDQSMLDAITKLDTGGNAITEGQLQTLTGGRSIADSISVLQKKLAKGGVLSNDQRNQISTIAQQIFQNYQDSLAPLYSQTLNNLQQNGLEPSQAGLLDFSGIVQSGGQGNSSGGSSQYTPGQVVSDGAITLTYQQDGTFNGSDGHTYDVNGNELK